MTGLEEYVIDGDDLTVPEKDRMGQALLRAIQADAVRFQTDIPELKPTDPAAVHAAAQVLRTAAGKTSAEDLGYTMTGWLDATDDELWDAYVMFLPWSIDGDVWNREGRRIVWVDDGAVSAVAIPQDRVREFASIVGAERLTPWLEVKTERRAERQRWVGRHPDTVIGGIAVVVGLVLIPLPGPGWPVLEAGVLVLVAGATVRSIVGRSRT